jgi:hypothetical protein
MWAFLLSTVLPALLPVATNAAKEATSKWLGTPGPRTFEETLAWEKAGIEKMEAIARLDTVVGQPSQWVVDLRASARYLAVFAILLWAAVAYVTHGEASMVVTTADGSVEPTMLGMLAQAATFFLLGDRLFGTLQGRGSRG